MAVTVCAPVTEETKSNAAEPLVSASEEVWVTPSTMTVRVPLGVPEAETTAIETASFAPGAGVVVLAESVVVVAIGDEELAPGHASNKL